MLSFTLAFVAAALALTGSGNAAAVTVRQDAVATSSTSTSTVTPTPTPTPGFVNNGTVGTHPCALPAELAAVFANSGSDEVNATTTAPGTRINQYYTPSSSASIPTLTALSGSVETLASSTSSSSTFAPVSVPTSAGGDFSQVVYSVDTGFSSSDNCSEALPPVYPYNPIRLRAPDDSIRAVFLPYAATLSELWVKDRWGQWRDVVVGFDNKTNYGTDPIHPNLGPIVGRYANRIKNGTFLLDGVRYNTTLNENGVDTLHGGDPGYDRSAFSVASITASNVTFALKDPAGNQGFPNAVDSVVTYSLVPGGTLAIRINATASGGRTPIMLSSHVYWQLEGFNATESNGPDGLPTILDHVFHLPKADRYIETDSILIPTGAIGNVSGTAYDFQQPRTFRSLFNRTQGVCGAGCQGWDTCFVFSDHEREEPVVELWSTKSGIKLSVSTNQDAAQVYTCNRLSDPGGKGSLPRKIAHGGDGSLWPDKIYPNLGCVVIEAQDWIDAVNHPEWGRDVIYGPERPNYVWEADYTFSIVS